MFKAQRGAAAGLYLFLLRGGGAGGAASRHLFFSPRVHPELITPGGINQKEGEGGCFCDFLYARVELRAGFLFGIKGALCVYSLWPELFRLDKKVPADL